ncbi:ubiquinol-cytochrome C reductase hinge domain-containing protein [Lobosporangium transversale]|uniref:Ubiquinol-cytochrome C reductase hinge domain-containing protein n=1 Tax=Lobosporangium transversale TaxID=64571 RepID=A0A1Y2GTA9_9FUNG|nr:ubiquinol-cytochrome C reductase hinge domain-containing protein [Lobosporangium transversale]ORZ22718.1 ubiquinol-cytochrome C reductase hinge domain-containing protein [Lobosporangium transversale]|eukprot:XP_021883272.1 ubiquinol-cytochrome C reductase hinge domain-containing protein [Lobosporangium transversale]
MLSFIVDMFPAVYAEEKKAQEAHAPDHDLIDDKHKGNNDHKEEKHDKQGDKQDHREAKQQDEAEEKKEDHKESHKEDEGDGHKNVKQASDEKPEKESKSSSKESTPAPPEPEEEEEPEDIKPKIEEACAETAACTKLKHHLDECTRRVEEEGAHEDCIEELYHFLHCVNECAAPKYFNKLA